MKESIETKLSGKKKNFENSSSILYKLFSDRSFSMVSLKVRCVERVFQMFFPNFSLFPYISMFTAHFVAYLLSLLELPRRGRTAHDHQGRQSASSSFSSSVFLTGKGYGSLTPDENLANFSPIPIFSICT